MIFRVTEGETDKHTPTDEFQEGSTKKWQAENVTNLFVPPNLETYQLGKIIFYMNGTNDKKY